MSPSELAQRIKAGERWELMECHDSDSPWLVCVDCAEAGQCANAARDDESEDDDEQ